MGYLGIKGAKRASRMQWDIYGTYRTFYRPYASMMHQTAHERDRRFWKTGHKPEKLKEALPNVSVDMIRRVLKNLRAKEQVECLERGQNAQWRKTNKWQLGTIE